MTKELEKLALEEIIKETKRGTEREKTVGVFGWQKPSINPINKKFLVNTIQNCNLERINSKNCLVASSSDTLLPNRSRARTRELSPLDEQKRSVTIVCKRSPSPGCRRRRARLNAGGDGFNDSRGRGGGGRRRHYRSSSQYSSSSSSGSSLSRSRSYRGRPRHRYRRSSSSSSSRRSSSSSGSYRRPYRRQYSPVAGGGEDSRQLGHRCSDSLHETQASTSRRYRRSPSSPEYRRYRSRTPPEEIYRGRRRRTYTSSDFSSYSYSSRSRSYDRRRKTRDRSRTPASVNSRASSDESCDNKDDASQAKQGSRIATSDSEDNDSSDSEKQTNVYSPIKSVKKKKKKLLKRPIIKSCAVTSNETNNAASPGAVIEKNSIKSIIHEDEKIEINVQGSPIDKEEDESECSDDNESLVSSTHHNHGNMLTESQHQEGNDLIDDIGNSESTCKLTKSLSESAIASNDNKTSKITEGKNDNDYLINDECHDVRKENDDDKCDVIIGKKDEIKKSINSVNMNNVEEICIEKNKDIVLNNVEEICIEKNKDTVSNNVEEICIKKNKDTVSNNVEEICIGKNKDIATETKENDDLFTKNNNEVKKNDNIDGKIDENGKGTKNKDNKLESEAVLSECGSKNADEDCGQEMSDASIEGKEIGDIRVSDADSFDVYEAKKKVIRQKRAMSSRQASKQNVYTYTSSAESDIASTISEKIYVEKQMFKDYSGKKENLKKLNSSSSKTLRTKSSSTLNQLRNKDETEFKNDRHHFSKCKNTSQICDVELSMNLNSSSQPKYSKKQGLFKKRKSNSKVKASNEDMLETYNGERKSKMNQPPFEEIKKRKKLSRPIIEEDDTDDDSDCKNDYIRDMMNSKGAQSRKKKRSDKREKEFQQFLKINKMLRNKSSKYDCSDDSSPEMVYCIVKKRSMKYDNNQREGKRNDVFCHLNDDEIKKKRKHSGYKKSIVYDYDDSSPERVPIKKTKKRKLITREMLESETDFSESDMSSPERVFIPKKHKNKSVMIDKHEKQSGRDEKLSKKRKKMKIPKNRKFREQFSDDSSAEEESDIDTRKSGKNKKIRRTTIFKDSSKPKKHSGNKHHHSKSTCKNY